VHRMDGVIIKCKYLTLLHRAVCCCNINQIRVHTQYKCPYDRKNRKNWNCVQKHVYMAGIICAKITKFEQVANNLIFIELVYCCVNGRKSQKKQTTQQKSWTHTIWVRNTQPGIGRFYTRCPRTYTKGSGQIARRDCITFGHMSHENLFNCTTTPSNNESKKVRT
jgi:hypothetical protein